ncbi:MAG: hypothetical protein WDZ76_02405 [Pseudohongiellaceae bacterium]
MTDEKQKKDLLIATLIVTVVILLGGLDYWIGQVQTTLELLELAYGENFGLFNNPMNF